MILANLRDGDRMFIDTNIFIYHFGGRSVQCKAFLERCARRELLGYTSTPVLAEVLHRRMVAEAIAKGLQPVSNDFALTTEEPRGPLELHNPQHG